jgi:cell division protein FtsW
MLNVEYGMQMAIFYILHSTFHTLHSVQFSGDRQKGRYTVVLMFRRMDILLLGITVVLTLFGLAMIASVSVYKSYQLTEYLTGEGSNSFYLWRSFINIIIGMCAMGVMAVIPYYLWERYAKLLYFACILLLVAVLIPSLNAGWGTSSSWLRVGPLSLQPSEFLKLGFIFYLSVWLQKREQLVGTFQEGFIPFVILLLVSTILVAIQPDLGSFLIISSIGSIMFFVAGGNILHLFMGGGLAAVMGIPIILQKAYIRARFLAFLYPNDPTIKDTFGFQIKQALLAIGSGGLFGVGYGKSIQKFGYLPEVEADMIFAAMAEELGFMRLLIVLSMYGILIWRGFKIAQQAPDRFGFLVATGITSWIAIQTIVNIAVNTGLFPLTGLTLPFISYGGSSLLSLLMAVGILLNISMHSTEQATLARRTSKKQPSLVQRGFFA